MLESETDAVPMELVNTYVCSAQRLLKVLGDSLFGIALAVLSFALLVLLHAAVVLQSQWIDLLLQFHAEMRSRHFERGAGGR